MVPILVALTFVVVILFVVVRQSILERKQANSYTISPEASPAFALPPTYRLSRSHIWIRELASGDVRVGLDELVQRFVGTPDHIDLKKVGDIVSLGEPLAVVSVNGKELFVKSPVNGQVAIVNEDISTKPKDVAQDPYGAGWFYVLKPLYTQAELGGTRMGTDAVSWLSKEFNRLKDFVQGGVRTDHQLGPTMADGGMPVPGMIEHLDQDTVSRFEKEFLAAEEMQS